MQCFKPVTRGNYSNVLSGLYHLIHHEGIRGSLKGSAAVFFGAGPAHAVYFSSYEFLKSALEQLSFGVGHANHIIAGASATLLHDAVMTPADGELLLLN